MIFFSLQDRREDRVSPYLLVMTEHMIKLGAIISMARLLRSAVTKIPTRFRKSSRSTQPRSSSTSGFTHMAMALVQSPSLGTGLSLVLITLVVHHATTGFANRLVFLSAKEIQIPPYALCLKRRQKSKPCVTGEAVLPTILARHLGALMSNPVSTIQPWLLQLRNQV